MKKYPRQTLKLILLQSGEEKNCQYWHLVLDDLLLRDFDGLHRSLQLQLRLRLDVLGDARVLADVLLRRIKTLSSPALTAGGEIG